MLLAGDLLADRLIRFPFKKEERRRRRRQEGREHQIARDLAKWGRPDSAIFPKFRLVGPL